MPTTTREAPPRGLSRKLAMFLADAEGADREAIEAGIAILPLGSRLTLAAHQVIDTMPDTEVEAAADRGEPVDFSLTEEGLKVIHECAHWKRLDDKVSEEDEDETSEPGRIGRVVGAVRSLVAGR